MTKRACIFLLLAALSPLCAYAGGPFRIAISCPVDAGCRVPELENILTEAYARAGYEVRFIYMPRLRAMDSASSGFTDSMALCTREALPGFPNLKALSTPLFKIDTSAFSIDPEVSIQSRQDLKGYTVGVVRGQTLSSLLAKRFAGKTEMSNTMESLVSMLIHGRVDALLLGRSSARKFLAEANIRNVTESVPLSSSYLYHGVNVLSYTPDQIERIDKALSDMAKDGTMQRQFAWRVDGVRLLQECR